MVPPQATPDVGLSWALQASLAAGVAIAGASVALMFRRPAMRALGAAQITIALATLTIWAAIDGGNSGWPEPAVVTVLSFSLTCSPVVGYLYYRKLIGLLAGDPPEAAISRSRMVAIAVVAATTFFIIGTVTSSATAGRPLILALVGTTLVFAGLAWLFTAAGTARRRPESRRWALGVLQVSFVLLAARNVINIAVAATSAATGGVPSFSMSATVAQAFLIVAALSLQLVAVLDEERSHSLLQSEQLRKAELAMASSQRLESLGRMAGAVAHDFNNVLTAISVTAQTALGDHGAAGDGAFKEIQSAALRGKALTEQLLAFARAGPSKVTRFDARAQVEKLREFLERVAGRRNTLTVESAAALQLVDMDVTQFDQVVINLVLNARDSMPKGGPITIRTGAADDAEGRGPVRITVEDAGEGISAEVLPHIFEPFYSTKPTGGGTGLGLAICDGIVRSAGGSIAVDSSSGRGSRFIVTIPRAAGV